VENSKPKVQSRKFRVGSLEFEVFLVLALFILALLLRVLNLNTFITWDEPAWTYRSIKFLTALWRMDFGGTFLVGHPGVLTLWSGATGISIQRLLGFGSAADFAWLSRLPTLDPRDTEALRKLAPFLPAARLPMAVLNAACVVSVYLLARRLFDAKAALLAALFLAFDPFHLALSRVLHIDALAADFMILSLLSLLVHFTEHRSPELVREGPPTALVSRQETLNKLRSPNRPCLYLLLSGAFTALAVLSKSYALFLAPFSALLLAAAYLDKERDLRQAIPPLLRSFAIWCLAAALVFFLLWPAVWVDPLGTVQGMLGTAFGFAATPGRTSEFFLGKAVADPGLWFYPVALAFRTTPLVLLGLAVALPLLFVGRKTQKGNLVAILAYACLFIILITLGAKKFDRYMLPVILALDIVAAWGTIRLGELTNWYLRRHSKDHRHWTLDIGYWIFSGLWILLFLFQTIHIFSYHPYYLAYYNPLLGGLSRAVQVLPVGWGEGMDLAARYLNQKEDAPDLRVATQSIPGFAPLFKGQTEALTEHNLATADYAVLYVSDRQQNPPDTADLYGQQPEHVVKIRGVDYAWIYPNTYYRELIAYLESQAEPDDIVLLDAASPFVKYYQGSLLYYVILDSQSWTEVAARLAESAGPQRLWYVAYPGSDVGSWISFQLNTHALLIGQEPLLHATVTHYLLTSPVALESSPIEMESNVNFGNRLRLAGYGFSEDTIEYRKQLGMTLRWRAQRGMEENHAFSLRLVDSEGHFWAQLDEWLLNPSGLPTSAWETGETGEGHYLLPIPAGIPPGRYQVKATVYQTDTLEGVAILDEEGKPAGMEYTLGMISITSPTILPTTEELAIPHVLSYDFDGQVELLGYGLSADEVRSGDTLGLTLYWRALRLMERDYGLLLELKDEAGRAWMEARLPLPNESYPTSRWQPNEILCPSYDLLIEATVPTGRYRLLVNLLDSDGRRLVEEGFAIAELGIEGREHLFTVPEVRFPTWADIAHRVAFLGYDLDRTAIEPGSVLHLTLYWQALATMDTSYTVFTHLLDAEGHVRGQKDSIPCDGGRPTTSWLKGEVITDEYEIAVDPNAPAGEYQIEVGMYDPKSVSRLPAFDETGSRLPDDRILLGSTIIVESETQ
jgi:4-amino-4-deoxy-L-arabinose transferase-like glycosyltransferase